MLIRPISKELYRDLFRLQNEVHAEYLRESMTVLTSKVYVSPSTCFAVQDGGDLIGYILSFPIPLGEIPPLTESVDSIEETDNLHLHDCVVSPYRRKSGIAAKMIHAVETVARARGYRQISLVAVHGMHTFWSRHGWKKSSIAVPEEYGDAEFMVKSLLKQ